MGGGTHVQTLAHARTRMAAADSDDFRVENTYDETEKTRAAARRGEPDDDLEADAEPGMVVGEREDDAAIRHEAALVHYMSFGAAMVHAEDARAIRLLARYFRENGRVGAQVIRWCQSWVRLARLPIAEHDTRHAAMYDAIYMARLREMRSAFRAGGGNAAIAWDTQFEHALEYLESDRSARMSSERRALFTMVLGSIYASVASAAPMALAAASDPGDGGRRPRVPAAPVAAAAPQRRRMPHKPGVARNRKEKSAAPNGFS